MDSKHQLFIKGEIIRGLDIVKDLLEKNQLQERIPIECSFESKVKEVTNIIESNKDKYLIFYKSIVKSDGNSEITSTLQDFIKDKDCMLVDINKNLIYESVLSYLFKLTAFPLILNKGILLEIN